MDQGLTAATPNQSCSSRRPLGRPTVGENFNATVAAGAHLRRQPLTLVVTHAKAKLKVGDILSC